MTREQLEKGVKIEREIRECIENIQKAEKAIDKTDDMIANIHIEGFGYIDPDLLISIPESVSKLIIKLVMNEHKIKLMKLEKELSEL